MILAEHSIRMPDDGGKMQVILFVRNFFYRYL